MQNYIIAARTAQGYEDWRTSSQEERVDIVARWHAAQDELGKQKKQWGSRRTRLPQPDVPKNYASDACGKQKANRKDRTKEEEKLTSAPELTGSVSERTPSVSLSNSGIPTNDNDLEDAVRKSVAATSRGNTEEDAMIARAIRASLLELQRASKQGDDHDAYQGAIQASITEASRTRPQSMTTQDRESSISNEHNAELEAALHKSLYGQDGMDEPQQDHLDRDWDDSGVEIDDDENIKFALEQSKQLGFSRPSKEDEDLQRALKQSEDDHKKQEQAKSAVWSEEEIVLEYIKKQSLAEEAHRQSLATKSGSTDGS